MIARYMKHFSCKEFWTLQVGECSEVSNAGLISFPLPFPLPVSSISNADGIVEVVTIKMCRCVQLSITDEVFVQH